MSTIKQYVFSQSEDFFATTENSISLVTDNDLEPAGGDGGSFPNFINKNNPNESYTHHPANRAGSTSVKRVKFLYSGDIRTTSPQGISASRCRATLTGRYRVKTGAWAGPTNGQFPWTMPLYYWIYDGDGSATYVPDNATISIYTNPQVNGGDGSLPSTLYVGNSYGGGQASFPEVSFTSRGADTEDGELNQHQYIRIDMDASQPTTSHPTSTINGSSWSGVGDGFNGVQIVFQGIPHPGNANFKPFFVGTISRSWEANKFVIDGQDNDSVVFQPVVAAISDQSAATLILTASSTQNSAFTLAESSVNKKYGIADPISTASTLSVEPSFKLGFTKTLPVNSDLLASTANLKLADAGLSSATNFSIDPTYKPGDILTVSSAFTQTQSVGLIYDINADYSWNTFNLNIYFESGFIEDGFVSDQGEYNWNFLETTAWDDWPTITWTGNESSWDNWPDDVWEKTYTVNWVGTTQAQAKLFLNIGNALEYTGAFTFAENSAFEKASSADLNSEFTTSFTAAGVIDVFGTFNANFSPSLTANIEYALDEKIEITGAFTPVLTANARTDTFADIDVAFALAVSPTFKPSAYQETYTAQSAVEINPTFKPAGFADLLALASSLTVSRLFYQTDPYNIHTILQDTRTVMVPAENRQTDVLGENRVNTIVTETRGYRVPQETRSLKLRIPPFKNRFTTPRIRQET